MNQPVMRIGAAAGMVLGLCACVSPAAFARQERTQRADKAERTNRQEPLEKPVPYGEPVPPEEPEPPQEKPETTERSEKAEKTEKAHGDVIKADDIPDRGPAAPKVRPGRRRRQPPFTVKVMADPVSVQSPQASLTRLIIGPASRVAMHRHPRSAKVLYLIKGRARVLGPPGTKAMKMMPGSAVFLPPGYPHIIENMGRQAQAIFLQLFSPPGPERVYRDPKDRAARVDFEVIRDPARLKAPPGPKPVMVTSEKAASLKIAGGKGVARILLEEKTTGSSAMALSVIELDGGAEIARHAHTSATELLYVISGGGKVTVAGETMSFGSDTAIYIPSDQPHGIKMSGGADRGGADLCPGWTGAALSRCKSARGQGRGTDGEEGGSVNFDLTEEQQVLQKTVRDFCAREIMPNARRWDEEERFPPEIIPAMGELGLFGMQVPERYGGAGMKFHDYVVALEEVARADGSVGLTMASHNSLCTGHILLAANEAQKRSTCPSWPPERCWARGD